MRTRRSTRAGYTLVEIIVVMTLIVIIAAISVPVVRTMMTDTRITAGADALRGQMAEARARAMEEGKPWKLGVITNTGIFQLAAEDSTEWINAANQDPVEKLDLRRGKLPDEIITAKTHNEIIGNEKAGTAGSNWEIIAIFEPTGEARDDTEIFVGKPGVGPMRVSLRGLTGSVTVEEFQQVKASSP